jgi:hypothetical protein
MAAGSSEPAAICLYSLNAKRSAIPEPQSGEALPGRDATRRRSEATPY